MPNVKYDWEKLDHLILNENATAEILNKCHGVAISTASRRIRRINGARQQRDMTGGNYGLRKPRKPYKKAQVETVLVSCLRHDSEKPYYFESESLFWRTCPACENRKWME